MDRVKEAELRARIARHRHQLAQAQAKGGGRRPARSAGPRGSAARSSGLMGATLSALNHNPFAKSVGGDVAGAAGFLTGLPEGARQVADDAANLGLFVGDLGQGKGEAWGALADGGGRAIDLTMEGLRDPGMVIREAGEGLQRANRRLNPFATPVEPTFLGELDRRFRIHRGQGRVVAQATPTVAGGPIGRRIGNEVLRRVVRPPTVEDYLARGASQEAAEYLASPFPRDRIHHSFAKKRKLPEKVLGIPVPGGGKPLPRKASDSRFVFGKPEWLTTNGQTMAWHFGVDPQVHGGSLGNRRGLGWSGKKLGFRRFSRFERLLRGPTGTAKDAAWVVLTTPPSMLHQALRERREERTRREK